MDLGMFLNQFLSVKKKKRNKRIRNKNKQMLFYISLFLVFYRLKGSFRLEVENLMYDRHFLS